jgi:hypothetical protein
MEINSPAQVRHPHLGLENRHQPTKDGNNFSEQIYKNEIPDFVEENLERLYANVYCTLARIDAYDSLNNVSTYVQKSGSDITAIILFKDEGTAVRVINQQIPLSPEQIAAFCKKIFKELKHVQNIQFYALNTHLDIFPFPYQQVPAIHENIIFLPSHKDAYLASLRGYFRNPLLASIRKIKADHPTYKLEYFSRDTIPAHVIDQILELARKRAISRAGAIYTDSIDRIALAKTLQRYGQVAIATINGEICAGSIWFNVGKRHFHYIVAYDSTYNKYVLGNQIWLEAILRTLDLDGDEVWLMGGFSEHKAKFQAKPHVFRTIAIYKSRLHCFINWGTFSRHWIQQQRLSIKTTGKALASRKDFVGRIAGAVLSISDVTHARGKRDNVKKEGS